MIVLFSGGPGGSFWNTTAITILNSSRVTRVVNLYFDRNGTLYIADENTTSVIWKLLKNTTVPTLVAGTPGSMGSGSNQLSYPQAAHVDSNGNLYVSEYGTCRIQKYVNGSTNGITIAGINGSCGSALNQLYRPRYFAFDETDTYMYIPDQVNNRIMRFLTNSSSGMNGTIVAGDGTQGDTSTRLNWPWGMDYVPTLSSDLFITNFNGHTVMRWTPAASSGVFIAGILGVPGSNSTTLNGPYGIKVDSYLNVYVADGNNNRIQMFCANNRSGVTVAGTGVAGNSSTGLNQPRGIAFDEEMNMYVADFINMRVQKFMKL